MDCVFGSDSDIILSDWNPFISPFCYPGDMTIPPDDDSSNAAPNT